MISAGALCVGRDYSAFEFLELNPFTVVFVSAIQLSPQLSFKMLHEKLYCRHIEKLQLRRDISLLEFPQRADHFDALGYRITG